MQYLELAAVAVKQAQDMGAAEAEAYVLDARSLQVEVADQQVETLKFANDTGIGIRVFTGDRRAGFAFSTGAEPASLRDVVRQALENARNTSADPNNRLPAPGPEIAAMNLLDPAIAAAGVEDKIELARQVERAARRADQRVKRTERCVYEDAEYGVALANSRQLAVAYRAGYCGLYGVVLAEDGDEVQSGMGLSYSRRLAGLSPESVGREAAEDAARILGAKTIGTARASLILSPYVATAFFAMLAPALSAEAVQKGRSLFKDSVGRTVASSLVTLVDDGTLEGGVASAPCDGEGVPTRRNELISGGVLQGYMYNTYTAGRDNAASTGNGVRGSFKSLPEVGPTNIFISSGETPRDKIIADTGNGFYVTGVMGMHTANPISGDFSVGASGVWVRNGELAQPVRGVVIAGNIIDLLREVDAVGDDLRFFGSQGAPTLRIAAVTVSGT